MNICRRKKYASSRIDDDNVTRCCKSKSINQTKFSNNNNRDEKCV
jgi:hypothetical protein